MNTQLKNNQTQAGENSNIEDYAERLDAIHKHLLAVENRLECLRDYGYVSDCDALKLLQVNLNEAIRISR